MRIEDHLRNSARNAPDKVAITSGDATLTWRELDEQSDRIAAFIKAQGVRSGDRIVLLLENGQEAVVAFFAIWKAGAVACPLHPSTRAEKLGKIFSSLGAVAAFVQARLLTTALQAAQTCDTPPVLIGVGLPENQPSSGVVRYEDAPQAHDHEPDAGSPDSGPLAVILHTSGSTGDPKGVMHTHTSVIAACTSIAAYLGNTPNDSVFNMLPLSFGYGLTQVVTMAMTGGTLHLEKSFAFPAAVLARMAATRATILPLVPTIAATITGMKDLKPGFLPDIRVITAAAAAMPPALTHKLRGLFPDASIHLMYGQTECLRGTTLPPEMADTMPASVGQAIPGTEAFIIDEHGERVPHGTIGELVISGAHVMTGYWNNPGESAAKLRETADGTGRMLLTGDLFRTDDQGFLTFISRRDDIIKSRGEKVSPQEVERALYGIEGVVEAAVAGVPDELLGQAIKAFVVLAPDVTMTQRDIVRHLSRSLEDYMLPQIVEFRDSLPRTATGKLRPGIETDTGTQ